MKIYLIIFFIFLSNLIFCQNYIIELCKGDSIKSFYVKDIKDFNTVWLVEPLTKVLYKDNSQIILLLNKEGNYNLSTYYYNNSCKSEDTKAIIKVISCLDSYVWIPNSFTPNGDGLNDFFEIKTLYINKYNLLIYNRWGQLIFESNNPEIYWDGTFQNKLVTDDVYVYKFTYTDKNNKINQIIGKITILK